MDRDLCTTGQGEVRAGAWGTSLITSCAQKGILERDLETPCVGVAVASCQAYVGPALGGVFSMRDALDCSQLQAPRHPAQGLIQSRHQHRLVKLNSASCDFFFFFFPGTEIQGSVNTLESNDVFSVEHSVASLIGKRRWIKPIWM